MGGNVNTVCEAVYLVKYLMYCCTDLNKRLLNYSSILSVVVAENVMAEVMVDPKKSSSRQV